MRNVGTVALSLMTLSVIAILVSGCFAKNSPAGDTGGTAVSVYFYNERMATDPTDCAVAFAVQRYVPASSDLVADTLRCLFRGPTPRELENGYWSFFSDDTAGLLKRIRVENGVAYLDLKDMRQRLSGATSSCGGAAFHSQVERTLVQFQHVKKVIYAIEGDPRVFYDWMNEACGPTNQYCDPSPFSK
jgi:spore germination protein GerM